MKRLNLSEKKIFSAGINKEKLVEPIDTDPLVNTNNDLGKLLNKKILKSEYI